MQSATYNNAVLHVEARRILFFFRIAVIFTLQCSMAKMKNATLLLKQSSPTPLPTVPSIHTKAVLPQKSREEKKEPHQEKKRKYIYVNPTAVHYVYLSSLVLIEKKCTDLDN